MTKVVVCPLYSLSPGGFRCQRSFPLSQFLVGKYLLKGVIIHIVFIMLIDYSGVAIQQFCLR